MMLCWLSLIFSVAKSAVFLWNWATLTLLLRVSFMSVGWTSITWYLWNVNFTRETPPKKRVFYVPPTPPPTHPHPECDFKGDGFEYQFGGFCCENLATLTILDPTVSDVTTVWVTVFIMWSLLLYSYRSFDMYWVIYAFWPKSQQRPSMKNARCQTYTISQS